MMGLLRSLFGLKGITGNRTVAGAPESIDVKDLPYVWESNMRLEALRELYTHYKATPHAQKILTVYDKTRRIHTYLVNRNKARELEFFHLQHTDHFLSTFHTIIDAHRPRQAQPQAPTPSKAAGRPEVVGKTFVLGPFRRESKEVKAVQLQNREASQHIFVDAMRAKTDTTRLTIPDVSIDTYSRIAYLQQEPAGAVATSEIGYTSTEEEKEAFVNYVAARLGIEGIAYVGNAMVYIPANQPVSDAAEMVPVIHWNGSPYVVTLDDFRLYPVNTFRRGR